MILLLAAARAEPLIVHDLEDDDGAFVAYGELGQWAWGEVRNGPGAGWDGANAWSTGLDADYLNDAVEYLEIPLPSLVDTTQPALAFVHWYELGDGDQAWVELDVGNGFAPVEPVFGYPGLGGWSGVSDGWSQVVVPLPAGAVEPRVRLAFSADVARVGAGWTIDAVTLHDGDVAAPHLEGLTVLADTEDLDGPYAVAVAAEDDVLVGEVALYWSLRGADTENVLEMTAAGDGTWNGEIPGQAPGAEVRYRVAATDGANVATLPASGTLAFRVYLAAPGGLSGPEGRVVGTAARLTWSEPDTAHEVLGYRVYRGGMPIGEVDLAEADAAEVDVPLLGAYDIFSVRARYAEGMGDASNEVVVDAVVPEVQSVAPLEAWPGDDLRVTVTGAWLLLVEDEVAASLGEGVTVDSVDVIDVDSVRLGISVAEDATAGPRALFLTTPGYALEETDAFAVLDADGRPRLVDVEPDAVVQGARGQLTLRFVGDLAGTPTVDLGEGLVVEGVEVEGDELVVDFACAPDAALGARAVRVDDGVRRFEGVELGVDDANPAPSQTCGVPLVSGLLSVAAAAALALRRRGSRAARRPFEFR